MIRAHEGVLAMGVCSEIHEDRGSRKSHHERAGKGIGAMDAKDEQQRHGDDSDDHRPKEIFLETAHRGFAPWDVGSDSHQE